MFLKRFQKAVHRRYYKLVVATSMVSKHMFLHGLRDKEALVLPDFLIIGVQKGGTTWLYKNLSSHPEIFMPFFKNTSDPSEVRYFDQRFHKSFKWYSSLFFSEKNKFRGEKSPNYYVLPEGRIKIIHDLMPCVKLLLFLRNPIDRAWSHALMNLVKLSNRSYETIKPEEFYRHFIVSKEKGYYSKHIQKWLKIFPEEQFFVGFYDDICHRPKELLIEVFDYLGVQSDVSLDGFPLRMKVNAGPPVTIPPEFKSFLMELYRDELKTLEKMFREKITCWME